jgi:hypothetical protein
MNSTSFVASSTSVTLKALSIKMDAIPKEFQLPFVVAVSYV